MFNIGTPEGTRDLSFEMSFVLIGMYALNVAVTVFSGSGGTNLPEDQGIDDEHADAVLQAESRHRLEVVRRKVRIGGAFCGAGVARGHDETRTAGALGDLPRKSVLPAAGTEQEDVHTGACSHF
jgi:hypothetical protein